MPMQEIINRRSIRSYRADAVTEEQLEQILRAAMAAPSAGNQQPWEFIVVTDQDLLVKITEVHPYAKMLLEAPAAIVVCGNRSREKHVDYWIRNCFSCSDCTTGGSWCKSPNTIICIPPNGLMFFFTCWQHRLMDSIRSARTIETSSMINALVFLMILAV